MNDEPVGVRLRLRFKQADAQRAFEEWGANCGPGALAVALGVPIASVRPLLPDFPDRRYTSPTMMRQALQLAGVPILEECRGTQLPEDCPAQLPRHGLIRIQWTGPWTLTGMNPRWAYTYTHASHALKL